MRTETRYFFLKVDRKALAPTEQQNETFVGYPRCSDKKTSSARDLSLMSLILSSASVNLYQYLHKIRY